MAPQGMKAVAISDPQTGKQLDYLDVDTAAKKYGFNPQDVAKQLALQPFTQMKASDGKTYTVQKEIGSTAFKPPATTPPSQQVAQNQQAQTQAEAASPAQIQAAKAINMKKHHIRPKNEDSMAAAEHNPRGAKFGGYWKGTDKNPPRPGQGVGGCEESIEEAIAREWKAYVQEAGASNPAQGGQQQNPQVAARQKQTITTGLQKISQATGKKPVGGVPTAATGGAEFLNNTNADPVTGKGMSPQAKKFAATVTDELGPALLDPQASQQIATAVKQATQKQNAAAGVK